MNALTPKQKKALEFITQHTEKVGYAPTLREICHYMGYKAVGSAQDLIGALRRKGYLAIPDKQAARSLILSQRAKEYYGVKLVSKQSSDDSFLVPQLGYVPAGVPVEAIEDFKGTIRISQSALPRWIRNSENLFALQAKGQSMINAGILDGDWLVVHQQEEAPMGSIVVAQIGSEATVKRLMSNKKGVWYLKPENPDFKEIYSDEESFTIIGRVVALQRSFLD